VEAAVAPVEDAGPVAVDGVPGAALVAVAPVDVDGPAVLAGAVTADVAVAPPLAGLAGVVVAVIVTGVEVQPGVRAVDARCGWVRGVV